MTTKTISGTYSAGYLLSTSFNTVSITTSGSVGGFGLVTNAQATVVNYGHLESEFGASALDIGPNGGDLFNHSSGYMRGGLAIAASGAGSAGNAGGAGAYLTVAGSIYADGGHIVGGGGGAGIAGSFGGYGGFGGAGGDFHGGGDLFNQGYLTGGAGGAGGASSYSTQVRGGSGGGGGDGVYMAGYAYIASHGGGLIGGKGGKGGASTGVGGYGGTGGAGIDLVSGGFVDIYAGFVEGGVGGAAGAGGGGGIGGTGIDLRSSGDVINYGLVIGGQGGTGVNGETQYYRQPGHGGVGVSLGSDGSGVVNLGLISGGAGGAGAGSARGGIGGDGIEGDGAVYNFGTIVSGAGAGRQLSGYGIDLLGFGTVINGSASNHTAIIEGRVSSYGANYTGIGIVTGASSTVTVTNFGTVSGGTAVFFGSSADTLAAEAGCVFSGAVLGGGGTLELGAGSGTVSGIDSSGNVTVTGFVGSAPTFQDFDVLEIAPGGAFAMASAGTIASGKTLLDNGVVSDAGTLTVAGSIGGSGSLSVAGKLTMQNKSSLSVADLDITAKAAKVTIGSNITFGGDWFQTNGALTINAARTLDLTNAADVISGKGVTVTGTLEVSGGGKLEIQGPVANNGLMEVSGGTLVLENNVALSGTGSAQINGGTFDGSGAFDEAVAFTGATGTLILGDSQAYTAKISGFSTSGGTSLDLSDIGFVSAHEATFSGTTAGGALTVTDGTHTAKISLVGNYTASTFTASSDGHGGVIVVDPTSGGASPPPAAPAHAFIAAMAGLGGGAALASSPVSQAWREPAPTLIAPRWQMA